MIFTFLESSFRIRVFLPGQMNMTISTVMFVLLDEQIPHALRSLSPSDPGTQSKVRTADGVWQIVLAKKFAPP